MCDVNIKLKGYEIFMNAKIVNCMGMDSNTLETAWEVGPREISGFLSNTILGQKGSIKIKISVQFHEVNTDAVLIDGVRMGASKGGMTITSPAKLVPLTLEVENVGGNMFTVKSLYGEICVDVYYNKDRYLDGESKPQRHVQYAEYQHYAAFASDLDTLINELHGVASIKVFEREAGYKKSIAAKLNAIANRWFNKSATKSQVFDKMPEPDGKAPTGAGSHLPGGPKIIVPENFEKFFQ